MKITTRTKTVNPQWILIDAENQILGRLATKIANLLAGKDKEYYNHDVLCGDFVIVINASKIKLTGKKLDNKIYRWHTSYPGGLKEHSAKYMLNKRPAFLISNAVKGMLPQNKLRDKLLTRLKVYAGSDHKHKSQNPVSISL